MALGDWFSSGRLIEVVVLLMLVEFLVLAALWRRAGGAGLGGLLAVLLAGVFLMLAVRAALLQHPPRVIATWLVAGLIAHVADLALRWPRPVSGRDEPRPRDPPPGP